MEQRPARAALMNPIEHQTMEMNVRVGRAAVALDQGDGAGVGLVAFQPRSLD